MEDRIYDYWVATLQDGYLGKITEFTKKAGGSRGLYMMMKDEMTEGLGITERLADYIVKHKRDESVLDEEYRQLEKDGITYIDHGDDEFPQRLRDIPSCPYGLFVKGSLPSEYEPSVAIVGARECSEYGRLMADYLGSRLAKEGVQVISGMAWGIDGLAQGAAVSAGGKSFAVLGCGVDIPYPAANRGLYRSLCGNGNGVISEYAPGTPAESRRFPPRNRIISGLCDVLIVVEARAKSGTLITVDMAIDQGRDVMVVPGRVTDSLSAGCLKLIYQGAHPVISVESVLEHLNAPGRSKCIPIDTGKKAKIGNKPIRSIKEKEVVIPEELRKVATVLTLDPLSTEQIADRTGLSAEAAMIILTKLEMQGLAKEIWPGFFVKDLIVS